RTLGARPAPAGEAEQARDHEQAGAGLGNHRDAEAVVTILIERVVWGSRIRSEAVDVAALAASTHSASCVGEDGLVPLTDISALIEGSKRARRARVASDRCQVADGLATVETVRCSGRRAAVALLIRTGGEDEISRSCSVVVGRLVPLVLTRQND